MKNHEILRKTNWALFQEQKAELIEMAAYSSTAQKHRQALDGIIAFLDAFTDAIVKDGILTEEEVFGPEEEDDSPVITYYDTIPPVDFYNSQFQQDIHSDKFSQGSYDYEIRRTEFECVQLTLYTDSQAGDIEIIYYYGSEEQAQHDVDMCNEMEGGILLDPVEV